MCAPTSTPALVLMCRCPGHNWCTWPAYAWESSSGAASLWSTNVLTFALWYWRLDGGGPFARRQRELSGSRAFLFPQLQIERSDRAAFGVERWFPGFVDYLFIAFNTSAAFSPTDTPVLQRWAKLLNMVQSLISLTIVAVLLSRAVGVAL